MKDESKRTSTPKLRFPEFRAWPGWENTRLGQVVDFQSGGTPSKDTSAFWNGSIPWVTAKDMKQLFLHDTEDHITPAAVDDGAKQVPTGTVLILTRGMTLLKDLPTCVLRRPMSFNQDVKALLPKGDLDGRFLPWLLLGNKERLLRMVDVAGHGTGKLDTEKLRVFDVTLPRPIEQQKIADCLTSLDELIAAHGRKLEALRAHKKGLMQQLFPREGETLPRLRFPQFRGPWKNSTLGTVSESISSGKDKIDPAGRIDLYGSTGVIGKTSSGSYSGTFLLAARVGANAGLLTKATGSFGVTDNTLVIILKDRSCIDFIFHYLDNLDLNQLIFGSGQPLITGGQLKGLPVYLPEEPERNRVAGCLSSLDALVAAEVGNLAALKTHKDGLMQQLFPSAEEGS